MTTHQHANRKSQPTLPAALRARVEGIQTQILDVIEHMLTQLAAEQRGYTPSLTAARRMVANTLGVSRFCARKACRRSRCCRGEPKECLQGALPLLPPEAIASLLGSKKERRRKTLVMPGLVHEP